MKHERALPRLYTVEEAAEALHQSVRVRAIRDAIRDGRLTAQRIGRRYFVTETALRRFAQCPGKPPQRASTTEPTKLNGSSGKAPGKNGQDLALASVERLKKRSRTTSGAASRQSGAVLPIRGS